MWKTLKQKIKSRIAIWKYTRWYNKMSPYYMENPYELKKFYITLRMEAQKNNDEMLNLFADWIEGWLIQEGHL